MPRSPFLVDVVSLRRHPGFRERLATHGRLAGLAVTEAWVPSGSEVALDVKLEAVDGGVVVRGRAWAPWEGTCRRCLAAIGGTADAEVDELFVPQPEEGETWPLVHDQLDLEPLAREAIVLELPLAPLCRPDCAGLCPTCGAELNAGTCGCAEPTADPRWAALDALRPEP
jgi:uncharacterized protein